LKEQFSMTSLEEHEYGCNQGLQGQKYAGAEIRFLKLNIFLLVGGFMFFHYGVIPLNEYPCN
jgi:hypothetical protein